MPALEATALAAVSAMSLADDLSMIPDDAVAPAVRAKIEAVMPKVVSWRRDLHRPSGAREPGVSNLRAHRRASSEPRFEVETNVAVTGVVGSFAAVQGPWWPCGRIWTACR